MRKPKSNWQDVHGILLLNKPKGLSSNAALQKVRRIFNAKKAGHTGSLDPMATGLLPCCFGDATKVAGLMLNADKVYQAECEIGRQTDTGDATGTVIKSSNKSRLSAAEISQAREKLTGEILQIPPMYSALHHQGKRLYKLARAGIEVERTPRQVTIHAFDVLSVNNKNARQTIQFEMRVSKGTYIRTLLEDFAIACGSFAHMTRLHRTTIGVLSGTLVNLEELENANNPLTFLQPMDIALSEYQVLELDGKQEQTLIHGLQFETHVAAGVYRVYGADKRFLGLVEAQINGQVKVKSLFLKSYLA